MEIASVFTLEQSEMNEDQSEREENFDSYAEREFRAYEGAAHRIGRLIMLILLTISLSLLLYRVILPMIFEIRNFGPPLAIGLGACGIVGLISAAIWGRRILLAPIKPKTKREKK